MLRQITEERGSLDLDFLREMSAEDVHAWLMKFKGVGPKTAAIVLQFSLDKPAFPVDTHVFRVTRRIGLAKGSTADKVSDEMMRKLPKYKWHLMHHLLITHGRKTCTAKSPKCTSCNVNVLCRHFMEMEKGLEKGL